MSITYDIFARKEHPEPLVYVGSFEVEQPEEISTASLKQY